jgi:hypothetical protein
MSIHLNNEEQNVKLVLLGGQYQREEKENGEGEGE